MTTTPASPPRTKLRAVLLVLAGLVVAGGAASVYVGRGFINRFVDSQVPDSVILSGFTDAVAAASNGRLALRYESGRVSHDADGMTRIIAQGVRLVDPAGANVATASKAVVEIADLSLTGGQTVGLLALTEPQVTLPHAAGGGLAAFFGAAGTGEGAFAPRVPAEAMAVLKLMLGEGEGAPPAHVTIENGTVRLVQPDGKEVVALRGLSGDYSRPREGGFSLGLRGEGDSGEWSVVTTLGKPQNGIATLEHRMQNLPASLVQALCASGGDVVIEAPVSALLRSGITEDGTIKAISIQSANGLPPGPQQATASGIIRLHEFALLAVWNEGDPAFRIERLNLAVDDLRLGVTADLGLPQKAGDPFTLSVRGGQALTARPAAGEAVRPIDRMTASLRYFAQDHRLVVDTLELGSGEGSRLAAQGEMVFRPEGIGIKAGLASSSMPVATFLAFWPSVVSPKVRDFVKNNIQTGVIENATIALNLPPGDLNLSDRHTDAGDYTIEATLLDLKLVAVEGLAPITAPRALVQADGVQANLSAAKAQMETSSGALGLRDVAFSVADHRIKPAPAVVKSRFDGSAEAAMALLTSDYAKGLGLSPPEGKAAKGRVAGTLQMSFPLQKHFSRDQIDYLVEADLNPFTLDNAFLGLPLEGANLRLRAAPGEIAIKGAGKLAGGPFSVDYRKGKRKDDVSLKLAMTLDQAQRARMGVDLGAAVSGPMPVKMSSLGDGSERFLTEVDLTPTGLAEPLPGLVKPAGQPAKARFLVTDLKKGWRIDDLAVETRTSLIRGSMELEENGAVRSGMFPAFHLSSGDKASLKLERTGTNAYALWLEGDVFDARPALKVLNDTSASPARAANAKAVFDVNAEVKVQALAGGYGEVARKASLKLIRRGREWSEMSGSAEIGRNGRVTFVTRPGTDTRTEEHVYAEDAGALLRLFNIYSAMRGGRLAFIAPLGADGSLRGAQLEIADFSIKGDEELTRMVAESRQQDGSTARAAVDNASFNRLRVDFSKQGGRIIVHEGLLTGSTLGATVEGELDYGRDRVDLNGTYVPAYALNNLLARIPVVGLVLGGGSSEGLVGITYAIRGKLSSPSLIVNPLSAVTPGIFRKILDFRSQAERTPLTPDKPLR